MTDRIETEALDAAHLRAENARLREDLTSAREGRATRRTEPPTLLARHAMHQRYQLPAPVVRKTSEETMGKHETIRPAVKPSERLQIIREMAAMGCTVNWNANTGDMTITPPNPAGGKPDAFDMVDFGR